MGTAQCQCGCEETGLHQRQWDEVARTNCTRTHAFGTYQEPWTSQQTNQRRKSKTCSEKTTEIVNTRLNRIRCYNSTYWCLNFFFQLKWSNRMVFTMKMLLFFLWILFIVLVSDTWDPVLIIMREKNKCKSFKEYISLYARTTRQCWSPLVPHVSFVMDRFLFYFVFPFFVHILALVWKHHFSTISVATLLTQTANKSSIDHSSRIRQRIPTS